MPWSGPTGARARSVVVYASVLLGDANRGLVLPTLVVLVRALGGGVRDVGAANSAFSFARLLAAPLLGVVLDRLGPVPVFVGSFALAAGANLAYALAPSVALVVAARGVLGAGAATLGVARALVSRSTPRHKRTSAFAVLSGLQYVGFTLLGVTGAVVPTGLRFPGYVLAASYVTALAAVLIAKGAFGDVGAPDPNANGEPRAESRADEPLLQPRAPPQPSCRRTELTLATACMVLNFAVRFVLAVLETLQAPISYTLADASPTVRFGVFENALFLGGVGAVGLLTFALVSVASRCTSDRLLLLLGNLTMLLGSLVTLGDWPWRRSHPAATRTLALWLTGFTVTWACGYPVSQSVVVSVLSKNLDDSHAGLLLGTQAAFGSAGRVIGPLAAGYAYSDSDAGAVALSMTLVASGSMSLLTLAVWPLM